METDFLRTLQRVAELGSMAEAARSLDLTPAAVAHHIRTLEKELGATLVARSGRTVLPTAAGHRLIERSRPLLAGLAELRAGIHGASLEGELRIGAINTALHTVLPDILARYAQQYPAVRVQVHAGLSHQLFALVQDDTLDVAVCLHPQFALPKTLRWARLREEPLIVLAPLRFARRDPLDLLRSEPFIRYDRALGGGKQADAYLRAHRIEPRERFELNSLLSIAMMVERGLGVSLVPDIGSPLTAMLRVCGLPLADALEPRAFGVLWKRASGRAPLAEALLATAEQAIATPRVDPES